MRFNIKTYISYIIFFTFFFPDPSKALTVKQEKELGKEVLQQIERSSGIVKDPFMKDYISKLGDKIEKHSGNKLFEFHFFVLKNNTYNAFALPGGNIFVHTGLIAVMDDESELAGILGHEIAHVNCRHISEQLSKSKKVSLGALAGLAAGILLGMNGADPSAVTGVIAGTQATSQSFMLSYSRKHETEADNMGLKYIVNSEYSPDGLLRILKKIREKETTSTEEMPVYLRTHPGTDQRISVINQFMKSHDNRFKSSYDRSLFSDFNKFRIKTIAFYQSSDIALPKLKAMAENKEKAPLAFYGMALLFMKNGEYEKSKEYFSRVFKFDALDPELIYYYANLLFLKGEYKESEKYISIINSYPVIHKEAALLLSENQIRLKNYGDAKKTLMDLISKNPDMKKAFYNLGIACEKTGDSGSAHFYLGKFYKMKRDINTARFHFKKASSLLKGEKKKEAEKELASLSKKRREKPKKKGDKKA